MIYYNNNKKKMLIATIKIRTMSQKFVENMNFTAQKHKNAQNVIITKKCVFNNVLKLMTQKINIIKAKEIQL